MKRRKKNPLDDTDEESDNESQSPDSDYAVNGSSASKKKTIARKPGRPRGRPKKTAQILQDDSDDDGSTRPNTPLNVSNEESENDDNSDSVSTINNSKTVTKKATARKRGRPPKTANKKVQRLQDDSDDNESTRPNTPLNASDDQSENDNSSDSEFVVDSATRTKRRLGRPSSVFINKKRRLQNGTLRDASPQPSTSQNGINQSSQESESDSDSNSADSDFGPVNGRSPVKRKPPGQRLQSRVSKPRIANKKANYSASIKACNSSVCSSQLNASQKKGSKLSQAQDVSMDLKLIESLAQRLVYYLLIEDQKKYAIRRKGIVTHVFKDDYSPKLYGAVINKANTFLKKIYGMELMELEKQKDSYLIVNILGHELGIHDYVDLPRIKQQQHGLILYLLTVIYMNENVITEDELTRCLKPLGIDLKSKRMHPVFGDVKKYITTELVKQMYLNYECISKEPPNYEFTWGLRAKQEFDKLELLKFVCKIMEDTAPEDWRIQFRDADASAKPNTYSK